jgi:predicted metalloprotease
VTQAPAPDNVPGNQVNTDAGKDFIQRVLGSTERVWGSVFQQHLGKQYPAPKLVMFSGFVQSGCGTAQSAMGPFYCPLDQKVYIDLSFYQDMKNKLGAPGDFAQAYVIAHEVGHHIQNVFGIAEKVTNARARASQEEGNALQVRMELQADCLAGIWAKEADATAQILENGDIEEALNAAAAIGDDRLQKQSQGYVVPEAFTHGSSAQRVRWFKQGLQAQSLSDCDTFATDNL